jgi:hypothetical protein
MAIKKGRQKRERNEYFRKYRKKIKEHKAFLDKPP